jgi:peptidoglycan glycosyltransferase
MLKNKRSQFFLAIFMITTFALWLGFKISYITSDESEAPQIAAKRFSIDSEAVRDILNKSFVEEQEWPEAMEFDGKEYKFNYSFDEKLTAYIKRQLGRYRSDFSSIVVIDNNTGKILSAVGHERASNKFRTSLAFSSTHPAASLIKIVTSADLLENSPVDGTTHFNFSGRGTTLYRYQLDETKKRRWSRDLSFEHAFAQSNNVVFGKAAIANSNGDRLFNLASNFGFNKDLMQEISLSKSIFVMPKDDYHLAELASGMNRETLMSPVHAAVLSSVIVNDGIFRMPSFVSEIHNEEGENVWFPEIQDVKAVTSETAHSLQEMMELTVSRGTARGSFRTMPRKFKENLRIGGKTGSLTGGIPHGRRDWFTVYAVPKNPEHGRGISISVMNVNLKRWYVRSPYLARLVIEYYYNNIETLNSGLTSTSRSEVVGLK